MKKLAPEMLDSISSTSSLPPRRLRRRLSRPSDYSDSLLAPEMLDSVSSTSSLPPRRPRRAPWALARRPFDYSDSLLGFAKSAVVAALLTLLSPAAWAQPRLPEGVETRGVDVWSDGTRLSGDLFYPAGLSERDSYPAIVMSHGWGGERSHLNQAYAPFFAAEGYVVLTIDYRGWGSSDSRMVVRSTSPLVIEAVRQLVDPIDQTEDIVNAISFVEGEPGVDPNRIGLWGSSYSGGHTIYVAAHDPRVKAITSQVGSMDSIGIVTARQMVPGGLEEAHQQQIQRVRGEIEPVPQTIEAAAGLTGVPYLSRMAHYSPKAVAHRVTAATLIIEAENEELMNRREHGEVVAGILEKNGVPVSHHVIPGITHYGIYREARAEALQMEIDWFNKHLKK